MKPSQLAKNLRAIAAYIENTPRPSRVKVASALKSVVSGLKVKTAAGGLSDVDMKDFADLVNEDILDAELQKLVDDTNNRIKREYDSIIKRGGDPKSPEYDPSPAMIAENPIKIVEIDLEDRDLGYVIFSGGGNTKPVTVQFSADERLYEWWSEEALNAFPSQPEHADSWTGRG